MRVLICFLGVSLATLRAEEIPNAGFELDLTDWSQQSDRGMSRATEEAARSGALGLRVTDESETAGSGLFSLPVEVTPGAKYELSCWARGVGGSGGVGVYLRFLDENQKLAKKERNVAIPSESKEWKRYAVTDTAPERAVVAQVWIHSFAKDTPVVDLDDFELKPVSEN